jgi:hypothetical protein
LVHYLGQRYILYNRRGNTLGVYSPNLVERLSGNSYARAKRLTMRRLIAA